MSKQKSNAEIKIEQDLKKLWSQYNSAKTQAEAQEKMREALQVYRALKKQQDMEC